ncbi:hypothetical protein SOVF_028320 [Spinacia oleracea]|nr:hypothetical protein SOVF_028320 [Spinacia oleracea]
MAILTTVLSRTAEEVKLPWSFKNDQKELEKKLKRIHMLLCGSAGIRFNNPLVDDWLSKVKNVAYEADDFIDEVAYEALKQKLKFRNQSQFKKKLQFFFTVGSNPIVFSFQMGHRVRKLMGSIEDVFKDAQVLGIKPVDIAAGSSRSVPVLEDVQLQVQRELVASRGLIGRDQDEANIIKLLCHPGNSDRDLSVVGIVGMAGLGKTALSKRVCERNEVTKHFEKRIWVCVSHDFEVKGILEKMVELVDEQSCNRSSYQATITELQKNLRGKRYLLVLDDVWDTISSVWESFCSILQDIGGSKGTMVLATSRSSQVLATMEIHNEIQTLTTWHGPHIHQLKGLTYTDSWSLFQRRVHRIIDVTRAERMVTKCGGVPLAINVLGDLLRHRCSEEWKQIEESELWKLEDKNGILPSLRLSFNYLPSAAVKSCFAYCAVFPEDAVIRRENLIQLWMAHGFLQPYDKMERIGNEYFNVLLNNSFFQDMEFDKHGGVDRCKMHDVVRSLAKVVSRQEFLTVSENVNMTKISSDVRHLSLLTEKGLTQKLKKKVRTVLSESLHIGNPNTLLMHAKCLRVLSLVNAGLFVLPDSIGSLKHLRYLDISENDIMKLPSAIGELYNLQTLKHLCFRIPYFSTFPTLPKELRKLVNLRYICTNKYSCMGFSLCIQLERINQYRKWGGRISDISLLNNIRGSLAIRYLEHISSKEEARRASLKTKPNIHHLDLTWSYNATTSLSNSEEVLEELLPHKDLKILNIWYYNGKVLPSWLMMMRPSRVSQLCNLVEMKFYYCRNLKQLPDSFVFPLLKVLVVWGCDNLTSFPDLGTMNSLETLQIGRCPNLEDLPNLEPLTNLRKLEIHNCARKLCLIGWSKLGNLPTQVEQFTQLQTLGIGHFDTLKVLPSWLGSLTCLEIVDLQHMESLTCLPPRNDMLRATRFLGFRITPFQCPKLSISVDIFDVLLTKG